MVISRLCCDHSGLAQVVALPWEVELSAQELRARERGLGSPEPSAVGLAVTRHKPSLVSMALLVTVYLTLEWLSFLHQQDGLPVTPWNPGHGVMLAAILIGGRGYGLVFFFGLLLAEFLIVRTTLSIPVTVMVSAVVAGSYTTLAMAVRPHLRLDLQLFRARDALLLFATALVASVAAAGTLGLMLLAIGHSDWASILHAAGLFVVGDMIGIMVFAPLALRGYALRHQLARIQPRILAELAVLAMAIIVLLIVTTWLDSRRQSAFYLLFLPIVVAAVRHGIDGACAALGLAELILVILLHLRDFDLSHFAEYQILMLVLSLTGLIVGALVNERRQADEAARRAAERLEELRSESARTARLDLLSGMAAALAHEINQPMTAARAHARSAQELLKAPAQDTLRINTNVSKMIDQIDHAAAVVSRMREFLRRREPHISSVDVAILLSEALALVAPLTRANQIALQLDVEEALPQLWIDRIQMQQVVVNLIRNAVEAIGESRRPDGQIHIAAALLSTRQEVEITVRDNGAGIAPEHIESLFEPLRTSRPDGIGLGLSICETIVLAHGGRIWLASAEPGATEFRIRIPAGTPPVRN